jgi:hypothetical protein
MMKPYQTQLKNKHPSKRDKKRKDQHPTRDNIQKHKPTNGSFKRELRKPPPRASQATSQTYQVIKCIITSEGSFLRK